ncbi:MAG: hypothetical protein IH973_13645 [Myxococcales bacterium]|nr:hypothetical protein [Myxococcales bacterium]
MMKNKISVLMVLGLGLVAIGLGACDEQSAPEPTESKPIVVLPPVPEIVESEANRAVRESLVRILQDADPYSRARLLGEFLPTLGAENVSVVKSLFSDGRLDLLASDTELLIHFWAMHDPVSATHWTIDDGPVAYRIPLFIAALTMWAKLDPVAAVAAGEAWLSRPDVGNVIPLALVRGWYSAGDPPELAVFIANQSAGVLRQRSIKAYLRARMQAEGSESVMSWALAVSEDDESYKRSIFRQTAQVVTTYDRNAGMAWCAAHCDGPYGKDLRRLIAARLLDDGASALVWISTAPPSHETNLAVRTTYSSWVKLERREAMDWMAAQGTGGKVADWLKPALPVYVRQLALDVPMEAIQWAEQIERDGDREYALVAVVKSWLNLDRDAAMAWLDASSLSDEAKARVAPAE